MEPTNYTYIRNTALDLSSLQDPVFSILLSGRDVSVYADTTDGNIITELSPNDWRQAATTTLIIDNPSGANNINLVSTLINDSRTRNWALQTALDLTTAGASVIVRLIRYGSGTATISINGVQVMSSTDLVGYALIQATDVDFYQETNLITPISGGNTQYVTLGTNQTITGIKTFSAPPIISTITNGAGTLTLPTTTGTVALLSDIPSTATFVDLSTNQTITGIKTFSAPPIISTITNGAGTLTLPTTTGTVALLSDIPSTATFVDLSTNQTIGGVKTFTALTRFTNSGNSNRSLSTIYVDPTTTTVSTSDPIFFTTLASPSMVINSGNITTASTLHIDGPPVKSSGAGSIINAYSLNVENGSSKFGGTINITALSNQITLGDTSKLTLTTNPTVNRSISFPDADGTIALTSALSNYVDLSSNQTVGGNKTFNGITSFSNSVNITSATNQLVLGTTNTVTLSGSAVAPRVYTIPDVGANASFVMTNSNSGQSITGQIIAPPIVVTSNTALTIASSKFIVANPVANITITLPSPPIDGMEFIILNRSTYIVNINTGQATDYFNYDGITQTSVLTFNDRIHLIYYSQGWYTI